MRKTIRRILPVALCLFAPGFFSTAQLPEPDGGSIERGVLPLRWETGGPRCMEMPQWQVHEYNPNLFILRQSGCTDYEKPFLYLLFGTGKALLLDTGSRNGNLVPALQQTVHNWLKRNSRQSIPLVVVHSHSHSDHVAGDAEIQALHDSAMPITFVSAELEATKAIYGIRNWPGDIGHIDLGDRMLDVIPIPGHSPLSVALYDRRTAILFPGDSLYPGRLYVQDFADFEASTKRMVCFTEGKPVAHILGNHIEQTRTPFLDYPIGTMYQPDEHDLALSRGSLLELEAALASLHGQPSRLAMRDFTIWPVPHNSEMRDATRRLFERTQEQQLSHMWDQNAPH
jgi:hydroxyacylglutathione hydrolase